MAEDGAYGWSLNETVRLLTKASRLCCCQTVKHSGLQYLRSAAEN
jgi:hypothetical protein